MLALERFGERWDTTYPQITRSWRAKCENLNTLFRYPSDTRKAIYTTNATESQNSVVRKAIKKRKFVDLYRKLTPSDDAARMVVSLAINEAAKKCAVPIRNWKNALNRFLIEFEDRLAGYV